MSQTRSGSTPSLVIEFFDKKKLPYPPSSFSYRILDVQTGTVVRAKTVVQPASLIKIDFTAADTVIITAANTLEQRRVAWIAGEGTPQQEQDEFIFDVRNVN